VDFLTPQLPIFVRKRKIHFVVLFYQSDLLFVCLVSPGNIRLHRLSRRKIFVRLRESGPLRETRLRIGFVDRSNGRREELEELFQTIVPVTRL
jgi:hypothetical protein